MIALLRNPSSDSVTMPLADSPPGWSGQEEEAEQITTGRWFTLTGQGASKSPNSHTLEWVKGVTRKQVTIHQ